MSFKREMPKPNLIQKSAIYVVMTKRRSRVTKSQSPDLPQGGEGREGDRERICVHFIVLYQEYNFDIDVAKEGLLRDKILSMPCHDATL